MREHTRIERRRGSESLAAARGVGALPSLNGVVQEGSPGLGKIAPFTMTGEEKRCLRDVARCIGCLPQKSLGHSRESRRVCLIVEK